MIRRSFALFAFSIFLVGLPLAQSNQPTKGTKSEPKVTQQLFTEEELNQNELKLALSEATPVQSVALNSRQTKNRKLYGTGLKLKKLTDVISEDDSEMVLIERGGENGEYNPTRQDATNTIRLMLNQADLVIIGTVEDQVSLLNESEDFIFTDYKIHIIEVVKHGPNKNATPRESITLTRPGGTVLLDNRLIKAVDGDHLLLHRGQKCLLFLKYILDSDSYQVLDHLSTFLLTDNKLFCQTKRETPFGERNVKSQNLSNQETGIDAEPFLSLIRSTSKNNMIK